MMHARAVAAPLVQLEQWEAAMGVVDAGIRGIERFLADYHQEEQAERVGELLFLQRLRDEIAERAGVAVEAERKAAADPITRLREDLAEAIGQERYEEAARLRDEIRRLEEPPPPAH
jgi:excinuclease UvrABC helicase subunit UvrB